MSATDVAFDGFYDVKLFMQERSTMAFFRRRGLRKQLGQGKWTDQDETMRLFYGQFVRAGDTCFDVGANVGNRTRIFRRLRANIIAVEPQRSCMDILRVLYGKDRKVTLLEEAIGEQEGTAELMICNANTISSLSLEWVEAVKKSGRFSEFNWNETKTVRVTTLDALIKTFGVPAFIKVDVEGYEYNVVRGLSRPVKALSLEFTPELMDPICKSMDHLVSLGDVRFNYSLGESMCLECREWVSVEEMTDILRRYEEEGRSDIFGDLYARFEDTATD
jgi:FkbM family methyltransferase